MPFKKKEKSEKNNGMKKSGTLLGSMFRRYNPDKVTFDGIKKFLGLLF